MQVNVEIKSKQIFSDHEESENSKSKGNIEYHKNGAVLEFTEKNEEQELKFKITILKNKIITDRNNQTMVFDLENKNNTTLSTPYGVVNMVIETKKIEVSKENEKINKIYLEYIIYLENNIQYNNQVEIIIS